MEQTVTVYEIMSPHVVTIGMDETLHAARELFRQRGFHHLVVLEGKRVLGVVSDRDILRELSPFVGVALSERPQDRATLNKRIHQLMSRQLVAVPPVWPVVEAAKIMIEQRVSCLPVIGEDERLVGIVTLHDIVRWAAGTLVAQH